MLIAALFLPEAQSATYAYSSDRETGLQVPESRKANIILHKKTALHGIHLQKLRIHTIVQGGLLTFI